MARAAHGNLAGRARRIVKLVRALRKGWIKADRGAPAEEPPAYLLWQDDGLAADRTANGARAVMCVLGRCNYRDLTKENHKQLPQPSWYLTPQDGSVACYEGRCRVPF